MKKILKFPKVVAAALIGTILATASGFRVSTNCYLFCNTGGVGTKSTTKPDYVYMGGSCNCAIDPNSYCAAFWCQNTPPVTGESPSSTATFYDGIMGDYVGD